MLTNKGEKKMEETKKLTGGGATSSQASNLNQNFRKRLNITSLSKKIKAFTLAEVLITLAIIGVVAALTIPTVITNYQKKMYVTQLKKTYNNLSNGFRTMMANEGVTKLTDTTLWSTIPSEDFYSGDILQPESAEFLKEFSKNFKVIAVYDDKNIPEGYNPEYKALNGESTGQPNGAIYLADGTFLWLSLNKTPNTEICNGKPCLSLKEFQETMNTKTKLYSTAGVFQLDVNGVKGPNVLGRDLFAFALGNDGMLYPTGGADYAVYANPSCKYDNLESCDTYWKNEGGNTACTKGSDGGGCAGRIMEEGWEMRY